MAVKSAAFTIIELIVVIAIISLLIALMVPCLHTAKQYAQAVVCGSNVKQSIFALFVYESDNETLPFGFDDKPMGPPPGGYAGYGQFDRLGWWWFDRLEGYFSKTKGKKQVLCCPSKNMEDIRLKNNILCGNYGVNQSIFSNSQGRRSRAEFIGRSLHTAMIPDPTHTLLIVDSGYSLINYWHVTDDPPGRLGQSIEDMAYVPGMEINEQKDIWPGKEDDALKGRHPGKKVNVGFADGHVSREKADGLFVEKIADSYKNLKPLWRPK